MSDKRTALLLGASGLIGGHCLQALLDDPAYGKVTALVRRPLGLPHRKVSERVVDFERRATFELYCGADDVFSCLGTTRASVPDPDAYRRIDFDLPLDVASLALKHGAKRLLLVTTVGADAGSPFFYPRLKGELEQAAAMLPFEAVHLFRPSFLIGARSNPRPVEAVAHALIRGLSPLLMGPLRPYRAISARAVALAMVRAAQSPARGVATHHYDEIVRKIA